MAAAVTGVLVGSGIVATRAVIDQTGPASLAWLRYLIGAGCLVPLAVISGETRMARRDLVPIGLLGMVQFGLLIVLLNTALQFIPAARAALLFATMPLLTMLFAAALGHESVTLMKTLGVLVTIGGVGVALGEEAIDRGAAPGAWLGEVAVLASAASGAACSVLYRPYVRKYPALSVSAVAMLAAVAALTVLAWWEGLFLSVPSFTPWGWGAVLLIGVSSGAGYFAWLWALGHAPATEVTVFLALSPVTATLLGGLLLAEPISAFSVVGLVGVGSGLWLAVQSSGRSAPQFRGEDDDEVGGRG